VLKRALGDDKAASVLNRIMPGQSTKGLEILSWMDPRSIADMIFGEHPQVIAIILSVLEHQVAADVLTYLPDEARPEIMQRVASLDTVQPSAMTELEAIMKKQFSNNSSSKSSNCCAKEFSIAMVVYLAHHADERHGLNHSVAMIFEV
jgi:flagellar motor switch protein FliG